MKRRVRLFAISTCGWCKRTKRLLDKLGIQAEVTDVDLLEGEAKQAARDEVARVNPRRSYPTMIVGEGEDERIIVGFDEAKIEEALKE
ncbi:MAG: glutaredoxin family protein [Deltaproteobacteria bacterium]|nr:glutaredoxin family protein [Deltaproteobacteria bacterium]